MNMAKISGSAFTAYQAGIMSLGISQSAQTSGKEGINFSDVIREYEEANKVTAEELKDSDDWRNASDEAWDKLLEGIDDYIDACREMSREKAELQRKAAHKAAMETSAGMRSIAASRAALAVAACGFYGGVPTDSEDECISDGEASGYDLHETIQILKVAEERKRLHTVFHQNEDLFAKL